MRVLVTGAAGYIGSHVVCDLFARGHDVTGIDRAAPRPGQPESPAFMVRGDIADRSVVRPLLRDQAIEAIIHLAADKSVEASFRDPGGYFRNNIGGTLNLLEAAEEAGVRRVVFSSSCAVYGIPERLPLDEDHPVAPTSPYGESKALVERILNWYDACRGLRFASLRYFNAAGAALDGSMGEDLDGAINLIPVVLRAATDGRPVPVFGRDHATPDGTAIRDYIHVLDIAEVHGRALGYLDDHDASLVLNIGTGRGHSVREVIETARRVTGAKIPIEFAPARRGDPPAVWADTTRAASVLGWRSRFGLEDIVATAWQSHARPIAAP
jgi:UDP-glucose-4-epimerase GalE